jgi:Heavy metal associated domain 2
MQPTIEPHRYIQVVHTLPGRTRFRLPWLRRDVDQANRLADALTAVPGMKEVTIRPYTGTVLCQHDAAGFSLDPVLQVLREQSGVDQVVRPGEPLPVPRLPDGAMSKGIVAHELATMFNELDDDVLRATQGTIDLGTLVTVAFVTAGALQIALRKHVPAPPWFTLGWWGFRTFLTFERDAHKHDGAATAESAPQAPPARH